MTDRDPDRLKEIRRALADLSRRVEALEAGARSGPGPGRAGAVARESEADDVDFGLLERLRSRSGPRYADDVGTVAIAYAGWARLGDRRHLWMKEHGLGELRAAEPERVAAALAALSHPVRLRLAWSLVERPRASHELLELLESPSPGQLYHHLGEMQAAGLVNQPARGRYEVAPHKVVPLLTILAATLTLIEDRQADRLEAFGETGAAPAGEAR